MHQLTYTQHLTNSVVFSSLQCKQFTPVHQLPAICLLSTTAAFSCCQFKLNANFMQLKCMQLRSTSKCNFCT